jgi:ribonuclease VapC
MTKYVLDASALLAFLAGEPGGDTVEEALPRALVSTVNMSEVIAKLLSRTMSSDEVREVLQYLDCEVVDFTLERAWHTAQLRPLTRHQGLSLGDRACLALAIEHELPVMTTDRVWGEIDVGITVVWFFYEAISIVSAYIQACSKRFWISAAASVLPCNRKLCASPNSAQPFSG